MRSSRLSLFLLLTLAACGKDEPTVPDSANTTRSAILQPAPSTGTGTGTSTSTDTNTNTTPNPADPSLPPPNPALGDEELIAAALAKANAIRLENSVSELELDPKLTLAAQRHAEDMKARNFFDHKNPDGKLPPDRVKDAGGQFRAVGENIAKGITDVDQLFQLWLDSKPHKEGLLEKAYTKHGIGYKDGHWVHVFGN
jgi:uncharacterized protein YkwD